MTSDLIPALCRFASSNRPPAGDALAVAHMSALDWVAVGRAGIGEPVARITREMVLAEAGQGQASLFGSATRVPARAAALVNGATSHALDYDDTHFAHIGHPSVAVFPAAQAVAEAQGASLPEMIHSALIGMELSVRVGLWLGRGHYQAGFHQTATAGAFGAAVAAARLLGLGPDRMAHVLGLTATRAAGLKAQFGTMGKPYNAGLAASAGVEAAQLVAAGFEANPDALEGEFGYAATHAGAADVAAALDGLGEQWLFEAVSHKFHACCHGLHAALEALAAIDVASQEVATITVHTHPRWLSVCNQPTPQTGLGAKFSYGTVLAMQMLGYDTAELKSYSETTCADPRLQALRQRVEVQAEDSLTEMQARVGVQRKDGSQLKGSFDLDAPMDLAERRDRVRGKARALIGAEAADEVWDLVTGDGSAAVLGLAIRQ